LLACASQPVRTNRSAEKLRSMLSEEPTQRLSTVVGDLTTPAGAHTLVSFLNTRVPNGLDHAVSITGGRHAPAKLSQLRGGDFKETMQQASPSRQSANFPICDSRAMLLDRRKCCRTSCWRRRRRPT